jgi:hypothetical protein
MVTLRGTTCKARRPLGRRSHDSRPTPGELLVNDDVLSCGPLPHLDEWASLRKAYWDSILPDDSQKSFNHDLLANTPMLCEVDSVVLWLGVGANPDLAYPLITLSGDPNSMRNCEISLTEAGESVLAAQANAVALNGIDDWILGVHLDSKRGSVWYHKDGILVAG